MVSIDLKAHASLRGQVRAFAGAARPLSRDGATVAAAHVGVDLAVLWSVVVAETLGCGFLLDRRPSFLFERHIFSARTGRRFDASHPALGDGDLSLPPCQQPLPQRLIFDSSNPCSHFSAMIRVWWMECRGRARGAPSETSRDLVRPRRPARRTPGCSMPSFSGTNSARCAAAPTGFAAATGAVRVLTVGCRMSATWVLNLYSR